jgi:hypothetical protein
VTAVARAGAAGFAAIRFWSLSESDVSRGVQTATVAFAHSRH